LKKPALSFQNQIIQSYALSLLLQGSLVLIFGVQLIAFLAIHNIWAWLQLTSANYIEHYGLLRAKKSNGRYERCKPHHSWNTNYVLSNIVLFHLERHSDHHAYPARRYQSLRNFDDIPELPNGYFGMYLCAYIPKLWFKIMDHRLLSLPHINGDLSKVNICPNKRDAIIAKYN
jgi:alkane 1-monooxygenase